MRWLRDVLRWTRLYRAQSGPPRSNRFVGQRLKSIRERLGASREELAVLLSIPSGDIVKFEKGQKRIPAAKIYILARHFDIPVADFFDYKLEPK